MGVRCVCQRQDDVGGSLNQSNRARQNYGTVQLGGVAKSRRALIPDPAPSTTSTGELRRRSTACADPVYGLQPRISACGELHDVRRSAGRPARGPQRRSTATCRRLLASGPRWRPYGAVAIPQRRRDAHRRRCSACGLKPSAAKRTRRRASSRWRGRAYAAPPALGAVALRASGRAADPRSPGRVPAARRRALAEATGAASYSAYSVSGHASLTPLSTHARVPRAHCGGKDARPVVHG